MHYKPGLNAHAPLQERLEVALAGASSLELAVAYAKTSGTGPLLRLAVPRGSRAVVGLGFGLSDPPAIEPLASAGLDVRLVTDNARTSAEQFHPKLYLTSRARELVVLSGSANLTGGGLSGNVEQYEEFVLPDPSDDADRQRERFEELWDLGSSLSDLRRSGDWDEYRQRARDRRALETEDRRRLLRLHAPAALSASSPVATRAETPAISASHIPTGGTCSCVFVSRPTVRCSGVATSRSSRRWPSVDCSSTSPTTKPAGRICAPFGASRSTRECTRSTLRKACGVATASCSA